MKLSIISALLAATTVFAKVPPHVERTEPALYDVSKIMAKEDRRLLVASNGRGTSRRGQTNWADDDLYDDDTGGDGDVMGDGQKYDRSKLYDDDYVPGDIIIKRRPIDSREKEKWIYGKKTEIGQHELKRLEAMWDEDLEMSKWRGFLQGWTRGFYADYDYQIPKKCFGREANLYIYYINLKIENLDFENFIECFMLAYNLYYMFDFHCDIEQHLYDLSNFCFNHDCNPEQLLKNEMSKVF